jgi:hypothetical protein
VGRSEVIMLVSVVVVIVSLFLPWYALDTPETIVEAAIGTQKGPNVELTAWETFPLLRFLLILSCVPPLILTYIVLRGYQLSWERGEVTSIIAMIAIVLILFNGLLDKPGTPSQGVSLQIGWFIGLAGELGILFGSLLRQGEKGRRRKPPGV